jgi:hypothetical protein
MLPIVKSITARERKIVRNPISCVKPATFPEIILAKNIVMYHNPIKNVEYLLGERQLNMAIPIGATQSSDRVLNTYARIMKIIFAFIPPEVRTEIVIKAKAIPIENIPIEIFTGIVIFLFLSWLHNIASIGEKSIPSIAFKAANQGTGMINPSKFLST